MNVLIIEDDKPLRELYLLILNSLTPIIHTRRISTVSEAMGEFLTHRPDLVILDFILPDGNGDDIIKIAKQIGIKCPKIALITAWNIPESIQKSMNVDYFLRKPFDLKSFEDLIIQLNEEFIQLSEN